MVSLLVLEFESEEDCLKVIDGGETLAIKSEVQEEMEEKLDKLFEDTTIASIEDVDLEPNNGDNDDDNDSGDDQPNERLDQISFVIIDDNISLLQHTYDVIDCITVLRPFMGEVQSQD